MTDSMDTPDYGSIGYHWRAGRSGVNLRFWRRGPWRIECWLGIRAGYLGLTLETPDMGKMFLARVIVDVLWGVRHH